MSRGDGSNLFMFRQQAVLATKRLKEKESEYEDILQEQEALTEEVGNPNLDCTRNFSVNEESKPSSRLCLGVCPFLSVDY